MKVHHIQQLAVQQCHPLKQRLAVTTEATYSRMRALYRQLKTVRLRKEFSPRPLLLTSLSEYRNLKTVGVGVGKSALGYNLEMTFLQVTYSLCLSCSAVMSYWDRRGEERSVRL